MNIRHGSGDLFGQIADAVIIPATPGDTGLDLTGLVAQANDALGGELANLATDAGFTGKRGTTLTVPTLGRLSTRRVVLAGVGPLTKLNAEAIRRAWGVAATAARDTGAKQIVSALPPSSESIDPARSLAAAVEGARLATYRFTRYYGQGRKDDPALKNLDTLTFVGDNLDPAAISRGEAAANAVELARDLSNEPASTLTPERFAEHARQVATEHNLEITVLGPDDMERLGMGAIAAVGKGSANPPRLIHLIYRPDGADDTTRQLGFIGKAITFDTGGYSLKPHDSMLQMKGDMAGGAAVLGAMAGLRPLGVKHIVHGIICAAENMISGEAFRPDDILTAMNGVTIEILSTDAEGRLVLADGLVYAARQGAQELIDLATLTGAKVVALGDETVALFANDDVLANRLLAASDEAGERMWRLPLTQEMKDQIKGEIGDIKNTGGRAGGSITAALFIEYFTEGLPWAHLDIAGSNRTTKSRPYTPKGATGVGVRTLLEYALA